MTGSRRRQRESGQELVEFVVLVTFFLILFFCILQVAWTAIEKFHMNHYALYAARVWSVCPCALGTPPTSAFNKTLQVNEALAVVKAHEFAKKVTGRTRTISDNWRIKYLWGAHSSFLPGGSLSTLVMPSWATSQSVVDGPVYVQPIPMLMPYSSLVMGGSFNLDLSSLVPSSVKSILTILGISIPGLNLTLPKVQGYTVTLGQTIVPMQQEPSEDPSNNDNDGYWDGSHARQLRWTDIVGSL